MDVTSLTLAELKEARPDLVEALLAQNDVQRELMAIKEERDRLARELAEHKRREEVERELQEAGLAAAAIPEGLRAMLVKTDDGEERKKLVHDLRKLLKEAKTPVSSRPGTHRTENIEEIIASWRV